MSCFWVANCQLLLHPGEYVFKLKVRVSSVIVSYSLTCFRAYCPKYIEHFTRAASRGTRRGRPVQLFQKVKICFCNLEKLQKREFNFLQASKSSKKHDFNFFNLKKAQEIWISFFASLKSSINMSLIFWQACKRSKKMNFIFVFLL